MNKYEIIYKPTGEKIILETPLDIKTLDLLLNFFYHQNVRQIS
jgi:hypothetical protein